MSMAKIKTKQKHYQRNEIIRICDARKNFLNIYQERIYNYESSLKIPRRPLAKQTLLKANLG